MAESTALIVGANRGIGLGVVREMLARGWNVVATSRQPAKAQELANLAQRFPGKLDVEPLDMNDPAQIDAFAEQLKRLHPGSEGRSRSKPSPGSTLQTSDGVRGLDAVLLNAGVAGPEHRSASAVSADELGALMFTNAAAPVRLARHLLPLLARDGVLAFTSSVMGSVELNTGGHELYRASKAALNSLTRGLASELGGTRIALLTLHPGWVRTDMGGPSAAVGVEDSARGLVDVIEREKGRPGHRFLDYRGVSIAW